MSFNPAQQIHWIQCGMCPLHMKLILSIYWWGLLCEKQEVPLSDKKRLFELCGGTSCLSSQIENTPSLRGRWWILYPFKPLYMCQFCLRLSCVLFGIDFLAWCNKQSERKWGQTLCRLHDTIKGPTHMGHPQWKKRSAVRATSSLEINFLENFFWSCKLAQSWI
jgi:hypothetical protein